MRIHSTYTQEPKTHVTPRAAPSPLRKGGPDAYAAEGEVKQVAKHCLFYRMPRTCIFHVDIDELNREKHLFSKKATTTFDVFGDDFRNEVIIFQKVFYS